MISSRRFPYGIWAFEPSRKGPDHRLFGGPDAEQRLSIVVLFSEVGSPVDDWGEYMSFVEEACIQARYVALFMG